MKNLLAVVVILLSALVACAPVEEPVMEDIVEEPSEVEVEETEPVEAPEPETEEVEAEEVEAEEPMNETEEMVPDVPMNESELSMNKSEEPMNVSELAVSDSKTVYVSIENMSFSNETITIKSGDTIVWTQNDATPHTVSRSGGPEMFDSGLLRQGQNFSYTFTRAGDYLYKCSIHPIMRGKIIVE